MRPGASRLLQRGSRREEGQALILTMLALVVLVGFAGLVIDIGRLYVAQRQLQQAVDASALAAGQDLPNSTIALAAAVTDSATNLNQHPSSMSAQAPAVTFQCLATLAPNLPCSTDTSKAGCAPAGAQPTSPAGSTTCNAVSVTETASVSTTLLHLFLPGEFTTVSASSTAAARGGVPHPLDVMVILDTSGSMSTTKCGDIVQNEDGTTAMSSGQSYDIDCAKDGVRRLMKGLLPCAESVLGKCGNAPPLDEVGLMVFPSLATPNGFNHDSTMPPTHNDLSLDLNVNGTMCAGNLVAAPSWYTPTGTHFPGWFLDTNDVAYPVDATNAVQTITIAGATGGTFTLSYGGQTTVAIAYNATAATVQSDLIALSSIKAGNVTVSGNAGGPFAVTFTGALGGEAITLMTDHSSLTPARGSSITIVTTTAGTAASGNPSNYLINGGLSNDFKVSNAAPALNPNSQISQAVTWDACSGGTVPTQGGVPNSYYGLSAAGGAGTYFAGAITVAQEVLEEGPEAAQPVIILLSDGNATANPDPGPFGPCQQAVNAAQAAAQAGTWVYSIAYNAPTSSSGTNCQYDTNPHISPFTTMQEIARSSANPTVPDPTRFYCYPAASGCNTANSLAGVFQSIGTQLSGSRLIPPGGP